MRTGGIPAQNRLGTLGGIMLRWALGFFVVALNATVLGFGGVAATAADIIFYLFLILFAVSLLAHFLRKHRLWSN